MFKKSYTPSSPLNRPLWHYYRSMYFKIYGCNQPKFVHLHVFEMVQGLYKLTLTSSSRLMDEKIFMRVTNHCLVILMGFSMSICSRNIANIYPLSSMVLVIDCHVSFRTLWFQNKIFSISVVGWKLRLTRVMKFMYINPCWSVL